MTAMYAQNLRPKVAAPRQARAQTAASGGKDGHGDRPASPAVGRRVRLIPKGTPGIVRWVGPTHFAAGMWIGVELDSCEGKNDGEVQGSRYFSCKAGHGVFVRPESIAAIKAEGVSTSPKEIRRPVAGTPPPDSKSLPRKESHNSLGSENFGTSFLPTSTAHGAGSDAGGARKMPNRTRSAASDDQIIGRILASEAFARILSATVADRVREEVAKREAQAKVETEAILNRMCELEQMVDDAGGAMDDIASMVQTISESIGGASNGLSPDRRDAATGSGNGNGGGDAGGGGRDDARVAELTELLCALHDTCSQAAETFLQPKWKQNSATVQHLTQRVKELGGKHRAGATPPPPPMEG